MAKMGDADKDVAAPAGSAGKITSMKGEFKIMQAADTALAEQGMIMAILMDEITLTAKQTEQTHTQNHSLLMEMELPPVKRVGKWDGVFINTSETWIEIRNEETEETDDSSGECSDMDMAVINKLSDTVKTRKDKASMAIEMHSDKTSNGKRTEGF
jgi:hypothetical protein